jgi:hypothetical protein
MRMFNKKVTGFGSYRTWDLEDPEQIARGMPLRTVKTMTYLCNVAWISRATRPGRPGTASSSSREASRKPSGVPK